MYTLSEKTTKNIERVVGTTIDNLKKMTSQEEKEWIENKKKCTLTFPRRRKFGFTGRGNPLLARRKLRTKEDLDRLSRKYIGL
jgi:hypothetical protein